MAEDSIIPGFPDANSYSQNVLKVVLSAIKSSTELPVAGDTYDYYNSFKGFRQFIKKEANKITGLMSSLMKTQGRRPLQGLDLEERLDAIVDYNDSVLEKVGNLLDEASGKKKQEELIIATVKVDKEISTSWNRKNKPSGTKFQLLTAKNILRPQIKFARKVDNSNNCFVPIIKEKPNSIKPLSILYEKVGNEESYSHPYEIEIERFRPSEDQLTTVIPRLPLPFEETPFEYVDTIKKFKDLCKVLNREKEFAVDLEHHSYRTFQGITCLMQISTRKKDYLVDTIELRDHLHALNESFTNPKICKIFHGADMDVLWLQRDFGVYVVNLFDTHQASRLLNFAHNSLAYLLKHFCGIEAKKEYQLADWRIRPLPKELIRYAREDTHYLLYIYDMERNELIARGNEQQNLLLSVYQRSKLICLKKYEKPRFDENSYLSLYKKGKKTFNVQQLAAFKNLFAWRDKVARDEDESWGYILPNHMLFQIAEVLPREQQGLLACCHPVPPLLRQYLNEVHKIILEARELSVKQPDIVKSSTVIPLPDNTVDLDNVLNCPHDVVHENEENLPTLLSRSDEATFTSETRPRNEEICFVNSAESSASVFEQCSKVKNCHLEPNLPNFISPYQRYRMAKPDDFLQTNARSKMESQSPSNRNRIQNLFKHLEDLQSQEVSQEREESAETDNSINTQTKVKETEKTTETVEEENKSDSEVVVVAVVKKGKKRKRNRTKFCPDLSLNVGEANAKPFTPFDYSKAESAFKFTPSKKKFSSEKSGRSSPSPSISKPKRKKMKKQKTIFCSGSTASAKNWPKK